MYVDKLDGRIDAAFFDRMSAEWRAEQDRCLREIERHSDADQSYLEEGVRVLELAKDARRLFNKQEPREKRRLLNFLVSNCSWKSGDLTALRQPFDLLADTTAKALEIEDSEGAALAKRAIWLGGRESSWQICRALLLVVPDCQVLPTSPFPATRHLRRAAASGFHLHLVPARCHSR